jgi:hypothetical protein
MEPTDTPVQLRPGQIWMTRYQQYRFHIKSIADQRGSPPQLRVSFTVHRIHDNGDAGSTDWEYSGVGQAWCRNRSGHPNEFDLTVCLYDPPAA